MSRRKPAGADRSQSCLSYHQPAGHSHGVRSANCHWRCRGGEGVGHAGFIDDQQRRRADRRRPVRKPRPWSRDQVSLASGCRRGCRSARQEQRPRQRRGEAEHLAARLAVQARVRARIAVVFRRRPARSPSQAGRPELHICRTSAAAEHPAASRSAPPPAKPLSTPTWPRRAHHPRVPRLTTSRRSASRKIPPAMCRGSAADHGEEIDDPSKPLGSTFLGSSMPSRGGTQGNRPAIEHLIDQQLAPRYSPFCRHAGRADLPRRFGPGRATSARSTGPASIT